MGFALGVACTGTRLEPGPADDTAPGAAPITSTVERRGRDLDKLWNQNFGGGVMNPRPGGLRADCSRVSMSLLAQVLASILRQPVDDQTALAGNLKFALDFPTHPPASAPAEPDAVPLGHRSHHHHPARRLTLERRKVTVPVLAVGSIARKPTAN